VSIPLVFTVLLIIGIIAIGVGALVLLIRLLVRRPVQQRS
jgi:Ni/Fe-hydrogenase subunit HybB-like protein